MKTIVNPATDELKILREYKEFLKYCEDCSERDSCTQECRDRIKEIFTSFPTYSQN